MSLKYAVLGLLKNKPMYGYEIKQRFEKAFGSLWPISYGQLYPTLKTLTNLDYVTKKTEKGQKSHNKNVYEITEKGAEYFDKWIETDNKKNNYSIKDNFTLSLFFADEQSNDVIVKQSEIQISIVNNEITKLKEKYREEEQFLNIYKKMIVKKMIKHLEMEKEWLSELLKNIK